jgi:hypothetical protein
LSVVPEKKLRYYESGRLFVLEEFAHQNEEERMNRDLLQKTIDSYMEKYELMTNPENHESYKWTAVRNFQKYWDIYAQDFGKMHKKAVSAAEELFDGVLAGPSAGIEFLCSKNEALMEQVRDAFRDLFAFDQSDYRKRQKKCEAFVKTIASLLEEAGDDEWYHRQTMMTAILYLAMLEPDDNFMYSEAEEKAFAHYTKYTGKVGNGRSFSLKSYYTLCEEVLAAISENGDLLNLVHNELEREADRTGDGGVIDVDGENHILTFDLIYCTDHYGFYGEQSDTSKRSSRSALQEAEREKKAAALNQKKQELSESLEQIERVIRENPLPELTGAAIRHTKFGEGKVTSADGSRICVAFAAGEKKFLLPGAIANGFLTLDDASIAETFHLRATLEQEQEQKEIELRLVEGDLKSLR